jgi:hypothetical protein
MEVHRAELRSRYLFAVQFVADGLDLHVFGSSAAHLLD